MLSSRMFSKGIPNINIITSLIIIKKKLYKTLSLLSTRFVIILSRAHLGLCREFQSLRYNAVYVCSSLSPGISLYDYNSIDGYWVTVYVSFRTIIIVMLKLI